MSHEHHDKVDHCQNQEHFVDSTVAQIVKHSLHDGACDGFCRAEACNRKAGGQTFSVLKPQHQGLYRGQIASTKADAHDKTVAEIDADQSQRASLMRAAIINEKSGAGHTKRKADGSDQGRLVDVLFHDIAQEGSGHAQEKDGETESPFGGSLGKTDVICDFLAEYGPAVNSTYAAVKQQRRDRGAYPFVVLHDVPHFLFYDSMYPIFHSITEPYSGLCKGNGIYRHRLLYSQFQQNASLFMRLGTGAKIWTAECLRSR